MEQSPSWEAKWFSASQEIPRILWNLKVYYCIYKSLPPVCVLIQINSVHAPCPTSWRSTLILSSHPCMGLPSGLFPSGFPTKTLYAPLLSPLCATCPPVSFFSIWSPELYWVRSTDLKAPHNVVFPSPSYLVPLRPKYSPQHPILKHP